MIHTTVIKSNSYLLLREIKAPCFGNHRFRSTGSKIQHCVSNRWTGSVFLIIDKGTTHVIIMLLTTGLLQDQDFSRRYANCAFTRLWCFPSQNTFPHVEQQKYTSALLKASSCKRPSFKGTSPGKVRCTRSMGQFVGPWPGRGALKRPRKMPMANLIWSWFTLIKLLPLQTWKVFKVNKFISEQLSTTLM